MNLNNEKLGVGITIGTGTSDFNIIAKQLDLAETQDLEFVEFSIYDWNIICGKKIIPDELKRFKSICEGRKIKFAVHGELSVNFFDSEHIEYHKEVLKRDIEVSSSIGSLHLITHFGSTTEEVFRDKGKFSDLLKIQRDAYTEMGDYAKSHNVILVVENLFSFFKNHYAPLPSVIANELGIINHSNVKATLDFSHAFINCNQLNVDFIDEIKTVKTNCAKTIAKYLAFKKGLFVGISAGANVKASFEWLRDNDKTNAITILCDRGERYLSCL